jgi:methyl-accepting chemotaxis protein
MATGAQRQVDAIGSIRESVAEVTEAVRSSAESASRASESVSRVSDAAEEGARAASQASAAAEAVSEVSTQTTEVIASGHPKHISSTLSAKSEQIGAIVGTITGIAAQTNLPARSAQQLLELVGSFRLTADA